MLLSPIVSVPLLCLRGTAHNLKYLQSCVKYTFYYENLGFKKSGVCQTYAGAYGLGNQSIFALLRDSKENYRKCLILLANYDYHRFTKNLIAIISLRTMTVTKRYVA